MMEFVAKPNTWFKEGTVCDLIEDYEINGLFEGIYVVDDSQYDAEYWIPQGYQVGEEVKMKAVCNFDEFDIKEI